MKTIFLLICLIFLYSKVENKVKLKESVQLNVKCHGLFLKNCSSKCDGIQNIESCLLIENNYECNCMF